MRIELRTQAFHPWTELEVHEERMSLSGSCGAAAIFVGTMRDFNEGENIQGMFLEHYPGMTETQLRQICEEAAGRWSLLDILVLHRVGEIRVVYSISDRSRLVIVERISWRGQQTYERLR